MEDRTKKMVLAGRETVTPTSIWLLFLFFGWSYGSLGKIGTQIFFYFTFGGMGIWTFVRFFTLNSSIKQYNNSVYVKYGLDDLIKL